MLLTFLRSLLVWRPIDRLFSIVENAVETRATTMTVRKGLRAAAVDDGGEESMAMRRIAERRQLYSHQLQQLQQPAERLQSDAIRQ